LTLERELRANCAPHGRLARSARSLAVSVTTCMSSLPAGSANQSREPTGRIGWQYQFSLLPTAGRFWPSTPIRRRFWPHNVRPFRSPLFWEGRGQYPMAGFGSPVKGATGTWGGGRGQRGEVQGVRGEAGSCRPLVPRLGVTCHMDPMISAVNARHTAFCRIAGAASRRQKSTEERLGRALGRTQCRQQRQHPRVPSHAVRNFEYAWRKLCVGLHPCMPELSVRVASL
jgi:hypothetical protein